MDEAHRWPGPNLCNECDRYSEVECSPGHVSQWHNSRGGRAEKKIRNSTKRRKLWNAGIVMSCKIPFEAWDDLFLGIFALLKCLSNKKLALFPDAWRFGEIHHTRLVVMDLLFCDPFFNSLCSCKPVWYLQSFVWTKITTYFFTTFSKWNDALFVLEFFSFCGRCFFSAVDHTAYSACVCLWPCRLVCDAGTKA